MAWLLLTLAFFAAPFWETKAPADWDDSELQRMLTDSPWAQMVTAPDQGDAPVVQIYLATAAPMEAGEHERDLRAKRRRPPGAPAPEDQLGEEYRAWLGDNRGTQIVLSVRIANNAAFFDEQETHRMEEESVMRVGRKKFKMTGHFPPTASDPYLRLAFPRRVESSDKTVLFDLYLPGVAMPFREAEFTVKNMIVKGKLEM